MDTAVTDPSRRTYVDLGAAVLLAAAPWTGSITHAEQGWCADDTRRVDLPESSHRG